MIAESTAGSAGASESWLETLRRSPRVGTAAALAGSFALIGGSLSAPGLEGVLLGIALAALVACAAVDLVSFRIPNAITYPATAGVLLAGLAIGGDTSDAALGGVLGGGLLLVMSLVSRGAVGLGDAKLSAFGGALVGAGAVLPSLLVASAPAAVICGALVLSGRLQKDQPLPYGPFLGFGFAAVALLMGSTLGS